MMTGAWNQGGINLIKKGRSNNRQPKPYSTLNQGT